MRPRICVGALLSAALVVLSACGKHPDKTAPARKAAAAELIVFGSAQLEKPLRGVVAQHRPPVKLVSAPSGDLARRVAGGAALDVVVLPEGAALSRLESSGKLVKGSSRPLVQDHLVIIGFPRSPIPLQKPEELARLGAEKPPWRGRLLVLDPATTAGARTRSYLQSLQYEGKSVWEALGDRRADAKDVDAIARRVEVTKRMLGIVSAQEAAALGKKVKIMLELTGKGAPRLRYFMAVVAKGHRKEAGQLVDFLAAPARVAAFEKLGFQRAEAGGGGK